MSLNHSQLHSLHRPDAPDQPDVSQQLDSLIPPNPVQTGQILPQSLPLRFPSSNVRMIALEEHEEIVRRMKEGHDATIKRLEHEIERLKAMLKKNDKIGNNNNNRAGIKRKIQDKDHIPSRRKRLRKETATSKHSAKWLTRYNELKTFHEAQGHCNVPNTDDSFKELLKWCQTQRSGYANLVKGQETTLTPERLKLLNELGFQWVKCKTPALSWDQRFEQLKEYKKKHGNCNPPQKLEHPKGLGNWVLEQRRRYRERNLPDTEKKSRKGPLTDKEILKLESLDFEWSLRNRNSSSSRGIGVNYSNFNTTVDEKH
ncbi:helicase domain protein [Nitzschia inconspicua]|uniref:Helicase domain protein n=1 Tax=Nitzschia inconspicua TaxID=303405 RepID=A0A9K3L7U2_9STRA|nr:helicase domain protein [Nitzschia inconspicua]